MRLTKTKLFQFLGWNTQGDLGPWTFYTNKKGDLVFFPKAPPHKPPSFLQQHQRVKFRLAAQFWQRHSPSQKAVWEYCTQVLRLNLTGYNLFIWYYTNGDRATLATIERLAKRTLINE